MSKHFVTAIISLVCGFAWVVAMPAGGQTLEWIKQFGTAEDDWTHGVAMDGLGRVYVSGEIASGPEYDIFLNQYDTSGELNWSRRFGTSSGTPGPRAYEGYVAADPLGNAYLLGSSDGSPEGPTSGNFDLFLTKIDPAGTTEWTRQLGGPRYEESSAISADALGNIFIAGVTNDNLGGANAGGRDIFVARYDAQGTHYWTRQFGTIETVEEATTLAADGMGNVYVGGRSQGNLMGPSAGSYDAFLRKYDATGNVMWSRQFGTSSADYLYSAWVDDEGDVFVVGKTLGSLDGPEGRGSDLYVRKYDSNGAFQWGRQVTSDGVEEGQGIWGDNLGNIFVAGRRTGPAVFVSSFAATNGEWQWTEELTNGGYTYPSATLTGSESGSLFIAGAIYDLIGESSFGGQDAFLAKITYGAAVEALPGDFNLDGTVDARDYTVWRNGLGSEYTVDDYLLWKDNYGTASASLAGAASVPEPASAATMLLLAGCAMVWRRHNRVIRRAAILLALPCLTAACASAQSLEWIQQFGTSNSEASRGVAVDGLGRIYVSGIVREDDDEYPFINQFTSDGQQNWSRKVENFGSIVENEAFAEGAFVAVDPQGNAYVAGDSWAEYSPGSYTRDVFLAKFNPAGDQLWTRQLGGFETDECVGISVDPLGNVVVAGTTANALGGPYAGLFDPFLAKYDAGGTHLWTRQFGTPDIEDPFGLAIDGQGNVYATGATLGAYVGNNVASRDAYLIKHTSQGTRYWTHQFDAGGYDEGRTVWADNAGNVFLVVDSAGRKGGQFLQKYNSDGTLQWSRLIGDEDRWTWGITGDNLGNLFVADNFTDNVEGHFVNSFNAENGELQWSIPVGTNEGSPANRISVAADGLGNVYLAGYTEGVLGEMNFGGRDAYFAKFSYPLPLPGDFNLDGTVDTRDYTTWRNGLGTEYTVDDYHLWKDNYGRGTPAALPLASVPEPATALMLLLGALGSCLVCRARKEFPKKSSLLPTGSSPFCG